MPTIPTSPQARAPEATPVASDWLQQRLAEAACHAVLRRVGPALRHEVAGFMQPVGMLMMVLQRRVQMPEPDLQAISKTVTSVSALAKEATTGCMRAMGWIASREDARVSLRSGVDELISLLAMELSSSAMEIASDLPDNGNEVPQSFLRSVLTGAVLAFCDQHTIGGILQISLKAEPEDESENRVLMLRLLPHSAEGAATLPAPSDAVHKYRHIDWTDVEVMAAQFGVSMARGEGWLALSLPKPG